MSTELLSVQTDRVARWIPRIIPPALIVLIVAVYANGLHGPFIFDDFNSVRINEHIKVLWPLTRSMAALQDGVIAGRPLVSFSLAVNYAIGKLNPFGYHVFNLATHIACTLLLYGVIRRTLLFPKWDGRYQGSATWFAAAATVLWTLHPLQTESVDYVTQRTETMVSMFLLLMLYCVARTSDSKAPGQWRISAVLACAAGMACKELMVVGPFLALLYQWIFLPTRSGASAKNPSAVRAMNLTLMGTILIVPLELRHVNIIAKSGYGLQYLHWYDYLNTQASVIMHYLRLSIWPVDLCLDYFDWPIVPLSSPDLLNSLPLVIALAATITACWRRWWPGFLGAWFFLILGPTSSVLPISSEIAAERRMYLPLAAVIIFALAISGHFIRRTAILTAGVAVISVVLAILTIERNAQYQSSISIWSDAVAERPHNPRAHFYLGLAYVEEARDWGGAKEEADIALRERPDFAPTYQLMEMIRQNTSKRPGTQP